MCKRNLPDLKYIVNIKIHLHNLTRKFLDKDNFYFLTLILIIFSLDRYTKFQIINNFNETKLYINNYINFDLIWNIGIGFGLLSTNSQVIYNLVTIIIGLVIFGLIYVSIISEKIDKFIYCIIVGGAFGNFYDRLIYHAVPDFIDLHFRDFHWFTFNVADIFISLGIIAFIIRSYYIKK